MIPKLFIDEITFSDDSNIEFSSNDIVVFVGPNNAGKSASLREINQKTQNLKSVGKVIKSLKFQKTGTEEDLYTYLKQTSVLRTENTYNFFQGIGYNIHDGNIKSQWQNAINGLGDLHNVFINLLTTENRLLASDPPDNISLTTQAPSHQIHYLQRDDKIEKKFSEYFFQAFGEDLIVHRNAGNKVPLYTGKRPKINKGEDRVSRSYLERLETLTVLHQQGDGMRSFVGVLLNAFISQHSITMIDEPEAFLHPPQARLLGKMLGKDLPSERQLFLATHSEDFLKGILDSNNPNLKIVRIQRNGNVNKVSVLDSESINTIWNDSILRHSNVLNGLFHSKVIICESDSDCRFYSAILDSLFDNTESVSPDILFIHCGGKHRLPTVISSLKKLNVSISVVADFDVLNDINPLKEIVLALDGNWARCIKDWNIVKKSVDSQRPELEVKDVKQEIENILSSTSDRILSKESIKYIHKVLKQASAWSKAKEVGKSFIPNGDQTKAYNRLSEYFQTIKLFIVEVGELEGFVRSVGNHGPAWVNEVLLKDLKNDPEFFVSKEFIKKIIK
jgi:predicted ATPase